MTREWEHGGMPNMESPVTGEKGNGESDPLYDISGKPEDYSDYFRQCAENRELLKSIRVVVPVRPQDGLNVRLAQMLTIWYGEGTGWTPLNDHMGGFIECTRANIAYNFRFAQTEKFLLMIDNDMEPPINLPYLLARHNKPIVGSGAVSFMPEHGPSFCFSVKDTAGKYRFPSMRYSERIPAKGLVEVGHVGTGALLIRRDVLEAFSFEGEDVPFMVPDEPRRRGMSKGFLELGEDIAFCNQARAKGFSMYVDLEALVGHRKTVSLRWDDSMRDPNMSVSDWVLPPKGKELHTK